MGLEVREHPGADATGCTRDEIFEGHNEVVVMNRRV
jgi:hypothetical protein